MRLPFLIATAAITACALAACGGSSSSSTPTPRPTLAATSGAAPTAPATAPAAASPVGTPAASATPAAADTPPPPGAEVEVTGIVGTVSAQTRMIEIKRLRGADVTRLEVGADTTIRRAAGGTARLTDVRTSDRIVATGTLNDRGDTLLATEITIQDVLPGAQPGG